MNKILLYPASLLFYFCFFIHSLNSQSWQVYEKLMIESFQSGNNHKAIEYGEKAIALLKDNDPGKVNYGALLNNLAYVYVEIKEYEKAEKAYLEVLDIIGPALGNKHRIYARTINYLGEIYLYTGDYKKSEEFLVQAANVRKILLPETGNEYLNSLVLLEKLFIKTGNYSFALNYRDTISEIIQNKYGINSFNYANEIIQKARLLIQLGKIKEAIGFADLIVDNKVIMVPENTEKKKLLFDLIWIYRNTGQYKKAIEICEGIIRNSELKPVSKQELVSDIVYLGLLYAENNQAHKARSNYEKALDILRNSGEQNTVTYALALSNLAVLSYNQGDYMAAEQYHLKAKEIRLNVLGRYHPDYVNSLNGLAALYYEWGNLDKAEPLFKEGIDILEKLKLKDETYFFILVNLGNLYDARGDFLKSADIYLHAYKAGEVLFGRNSLKFAELLKKIADLYRKYGNFEFAGNLYRECIQSTLASVGEKHPFYANVLNSKGVMHMLEGDYLNASKDFEESVKIKKSLYGELHFQYAVGQNNLAAVYYNTGDKKKAEINLVGANETLINHAISYLTYLTGQESEAYLKSTDYLFDVYYSFYFLEMNWNEALPGYAYDNALARKALLLQSEKSLRQAIMGSKNQSLTDDYQEFVNLKELLAKHYTLYSNLNADTIERLEQKSEILEKKLSANSEVFKIRNKYNSTGWKDIKKSLLKNEAAIEFIRFSYYNLKATDSIFYCAIIMRPEYKFPRMVYLFEEKELIGLVDKKNFRSDESYISALYHKKERKQYGHKPESDTISRKLDKFLWQPLEKYLDGVKTIYYSPAGLLNNISFAALSVNDTTYVSDKYKLNTLLSTRNLIDYKRYSNTGIKNLNLYGGIEYDLNPDELVNITRAYRKDSVNYPVNTMNQLPGKKQKRGENWNYLHGTLEEIEAIENLYKKSDIEIVSYKGKEAVEETFKQYSGDKESPDIIHIATHGFFFPDESDSKVEQDETPDKRSIFQASQNPLIRSGLLFAGANRSWSLQELPDKVEDGILTAFEVSNTILNTTKLVVLSACETGLGEINGSEGVYGLQRSFKIAGAEHIIMSLWQIPDYQTSELMKSFYSYLNLNLSIPEAFQQAQDEMKQKYLPYYWAAFVLIR
jgi:CHAT domain-containing protein